MQVECPECKRRIATVRFGNKRRPERPAAVSAFFLPSPTSSTPSSNLFRPRAHTRLLDARLVSAHSWPYWYPWMLFTRAPSLERRRTTLAELPRMARSRAPSNATGRRA
jgi:hypothetical protein